MMCSAFAPDSRSDNSIFKVIGYVHCPNTMCSDTPCVHKNIFFNLSTEATINVFKGRQRVNCSTFPLWNKKNVFLEVWSSQGFYNFEETQEARQDVFGDMF